MPLVSVLLPLKDSAPFLAECLASLNQQIFRDFEILAVNHDSTDQTAAMLEEYRGHDPRMRILEQKGGSLLDALNLGLKAAQGEFVARMDGDDVCHPMRLARQAEFLLTHPGAGVAGCRVEMLYEAGISEGYQDYEEWVNSLCQPVDLLRELFVECPLPHPTWMVRRSLYEKLGGYQDDTLPEDYHFLLRAVESGAGLAKVPERLLKWRDHPLRHSRKHPRYRRQAFFRLKARFIQRLLLKRRPCVVWGAGDRARLLVRFLQGEGAKVEFCVGLEEEGKRPTSAHGVPVLLPGEVPAGLPGPLIACVGAPGARGVIRGWASARGLAEGRDYWFAS
jgi:glycosyltransferase involved in cell wall biosynthesis